jgi:hypothetical protein
MPTPSLQHHYNAFIATTGRSAAIASPQPFGVCFPLSVLQSDNDFTCSDAEPDLMSCQLNPGSGTAGNPVTAVLGLGCKRTHPIFTPLTPYRGFNIGSLSFSSFRSQLQGSLPSLLLIAQHMCVSATRTMRCFNNSPGSASLGGQSSRSRKAPISASACPPPFHGEDFKSHTFCRFAKAGIFSTKLH